MKWVGFAVVVVITGGNFEDNKSNLGGDNWWTDPQLEEVAVKAGEVDAEWILLFDEYDIWWFFWGFGRGKSVNSGYV